jgi:hypothetical protein
MKPYKGHSNSPDSTNSRIKVCLSQFELLIFRFLDRTKIPKSEFISFEFWISKLLDRTKIQRRETLPWETLLPIMESTSFNKEYTISVLYLKKIVANISWSYNWFWLFFDERNDNASDISGWINQKLV